MPDNKIAQKSRDWRMVGDVTMKHKQKSMRLESVVIIHAKNWSIIARMRGCFTFWLGGLRDHQSNTNVS